MGWLSGWDKRIKLTIDKDVVDTAAQTNFPVMVYLSAASGIGDVDVSAVFDELTSNDNRKKIAVTSADGTTELYVEIERWDDANEKAWLHVKVPSVAYDADTILYLYYDADHADNDTYVGDTTDAVTHNVWDADFKAVYHMAQDPNGDVADAIKDSTSNANDGTPAGTMLTADLVDGKVGKAIDFDGADDAINVGTFGAVSNFTIEAIVNHDDTALDAVVSNYAGNFATAYHYGLRVDGSDVKCFIDDGSTWNQAQYAGDASNGWQYIYGTFTSSVSIIAGQQSGTAIDSVGLPASITPGDDLYIGRDGGPAGSATAQGFWDGKICEVRISYSVRSAPWIKATYHSLWDSLITFGAEEINLDINVSATTATLTVTPNAATVIGATGVYPSTVALTITPNAATVAFGIPVAATCVSLTITPNAATVSYDVVASASVASLTITPNAATISWNLDISATLAELTIATHDATIWEGATWAAWIAANGDKVVIKYYFTLTGDGEDPVVDDVEIPIASFQCRRRSGSPTYLSVVIRGTDYADEVNARSNGDLKVEMAYELYGSEIYRETVAIVDLEDIQVDEGSSSASIVLTGHRTITYTPKQMTLRDIVYYQLKDGKYRFRCSIPNLYLAPGDTAIGDGNEFTVDEIQYIVSSELQMMEVKET